MKRAKRSWDNVNAHTRDQILRRDGYMCAYCFGDANEVDHIIPRVHGGSHSPDNLIASCRVCNAVASDKVFDSLHAKREYIQRQIQLRAKRFLPPKCIECGRVYGMFEEGSSAFMCPACYSADNNDPRT